ncbi:hypothetical protein Bbelb_391520 [Branchiostoma belcheri]|nr:hypothetical protein Bbelb_391520 [Branchiostoma belcheri]
MEEREKWRIPNRNGERDRHRHGIGTGVFGKRSISSERRPDLEHTDLEVCCVEVNPEKAHKMLLVAQRKLYRFDPHMLDTPKAHVETFKGSLHYQGPVLWNSLAADQRQLASSPGPGNELD